MKTYILPYKAWSRSAKVLALALGCKRLRLDGPQPQSTDLVINWGNSRWINPGCNVLNPPDVTVTGSNKLKAFVKFKEAGVSIPDFWFNREDIPDGAYPIVCRTILSGHSGAGIVIADTDSDLVDCGLYVRYVKKKDEYRVHANKNGGFIAIQKKARILGFENPNWQVRNHQNGFIYKRQDINPPGCVLAEATQALIATNLDFGAVDVIYNDNEHKAYVLEVNTAPGLEGQTVQDYVSYFKQKQAEYDI